MSEAAIVDVDGVCANFIKGVEQVLNWKFSEEVLKRWDIIKELPSDLREELYEILTEPEFWLNLEVIEGAQEGITYLESRGLPIIWATSPWTSCKSWRTARRMWLNRHFDLEKRGHAYIPTADKQHISGSFIIDDKPENVRLWLAAHPAKKGFIYDAPYNKDFTEAPRFTWEKVRSLV